MEIKYINKSAALKNIFFFKGNETKKKHVQQSATRQMYAIISGSPKRLNEIFI